MPDYSGLRITPSHTAEAAAKNQRVAGNLLRLRRALRQHFAAPASREPGAPSRPASAGGVMALRLATWNIREFDSNKFGRRLDESLYYIAEILTHFDLIAVQEIREDRRALEAVMALLGPTWDYIASDVTEGTGGNRERMVFIFNTHKVQFQNVAGEVLLPPSNSGETLHCVAAIPLALPDGADIPLRADVKTYRRAGRERLDEEVRVRLPEETRLTLPPGTRLVLPRRTDIARDPEGRPFLPAGTGLSRVLLQLPPRTLEAEKLDFARSPFLVTFQAGWLRLSLCTVHIYYGDGELGLRRRQAEIYRLTDFLSRRAQNEHDSDADSFFIALGDFNIVDRQHETMQALERHGFLVPEQLQTLPGTNVAKDKYYDQIAYWSGAGTAVRAPDAVTRVDVLRANVFDFFESVFRDCPALEGDAGNGCQEDIDYYSARITSLRQAIEEAIARQEARGPLADANRAAIRQRVYRDWRTYQMSDHLPMWLELRIDFGEEFLEAIAGQ